MSVDIKTYNDLEQELESARITLIALNDSIRRFAGRSPKLSKDRHENKSLYEAKRSDYDRQCQKSYPEATIKKRNYESKSVFNRLSSPTLRCNEEDLKPKLTSRVIRELPSRQEIVAAQGTDSESRARNRRIFGSLLGTLHKFCQEESRLKQKEEKKAKIEKKLEEQEILERESLKKERALLFLDRKRKQMDIKKLELKMSRLKDFETWKTSTKYLRSYIKTKSFPPIHYRPKVMSKKTEKLLSESQNGLTELLSQKNEVLKKDLSLIEESFRMNEFDDDEYSDRFSHMSRNFIDEENADDDETLRCPNSVVSAVSFIKGDADFKENNRNSNETTLSSSVVVVKHISSNTDLQ
uniref:Pinin/SDK/MemA protein domain-containing protein n=1 Tax=Glossina brevipalpis TaxID=37001 RepID=A0A1A9WYM3_9MUSC